MPSKVLLVRCFYLVRLAVRGAMAGVMRDVALLSLATLLGLAGVGFLLAAGFALMVQVMGLIVALAVTGVILLLLAGLALLLRRDRVVVVAVPEPAPQPNPSPDPLAQMVFDLSFRLGRELTRRKY